MKVLGTTVLLAFIKLRILMGASRYCSKSKPFDYGQRLWELKNSDNVDNN